MHLLWLMGSIVIVVGGISLFRLHAFLALVIAALVAGCLVPPAAVEPWAVEKTAIGARRAGSAIRLTLGNKNIALARVAALAMGVLVWQRRSRSSDLKDSIPSALSNGGMTILLIAVRTAQDSATVTMITAVGVLSGVAQSRQWRSPGSRAAIPCFWRWRLAAARN